MSKLTEVPVAWDAIDGEHLEPGAISYIRFLGQKLYCEYEPLQFRTFENQLIDWLNNLDDDADRQLMLALLLDVFFVGRREFASLYRTAYNGVISNWLVDRCAIDVFNSDVNETIRLCANGSWICPVTDSMRINSFLKTNNLISHEFRPDWLSLREFGDVDKIRGYISSSRIERIILLEDFIGSGNQAKKVVKFIGENLPDICVLLCPLVICPSGDVKLTELVEKYPNISYSPTLILPQESILSPDEQPDDSNIKKAARKLLSNIESRFQLPSFETMYGFKSTGSQVVLYSNCPNNTIQLFHYEGEGWIPLFPRVRRVK